MLKYKHKVAIAKSFTIVSVLSLSVIFPLLIFSLIPLRIDGDKQILIIRGQSFPEIAEKLSNKNIIPSEASFNIASVLFGFAGRYKAGEYDFYDGMSVMSIMSRIAEGDRKLRKITIIEGMQTNEIIKILKSNHYLSGDLKENYLEGGILPSTYHFTFGFSRKKLLQKMRNDATSKLNKLWENRAEDLPLRNKQEAVILASIVEKEAFIASERAKIAAVFINRLKLGMKLQSDPTVIYALERDGKYLNTLLSRNDLKYKSKFSTYHSYGLPPTPICNPGEASIMAVLQPAKHDYLYFVADAQGGHFFSRNLKQHNLNIRKYKKLLASLSQKNKKNKRNKEDKKN